MLTILRMADRMAPLAGGGTLCKLTESELDDRRLIEMGVIHSGSYPAKSSFVMLLPEMILE